MTRIEHPDQLAGIGFMLGDLHRALHVLKAMNGDKPISVRTASDAFNTTPAFIRSALRAGAGLYLTGDDRNPGVQFIEPGEPSFYEGTEAAL